ncbi:unnamed protein product [Oreochromis niloticus]|nr:unnamed protein product [Mustela putorius furo]
MAAPGDAEGYDMVMHFNKSSNPFLSESLESGTVNVDRATNVNNRIYSSNPFITDVELTPAASIAAANMTEFEAAWHLTPPPSAHTNPFLTPTAKQNAVCSELKQFQCSDCEGPGNITSTPLTGGQHGTHDHLSWIVTSLPCSQPFTAMNCTCNVPTKPQFTEPTKRHIMPGTPQPAQYSYEMPAQGYFSPTPRMVIPAPAGGCGLCKHGQGHSSKQATPGPRGCFPRAVQDSGFADCGADEQTRGEEKIPTLQPDYFDGSGSWKDFLYEFETCAKANCWTEKTMAVQLRFSLRGAAGAIIHKNPKSARWSYQRIVEEVEAAYGPCSEHAAAIGIELRQRIRKPGEALHTLRDDIYEKVSIVYANCSELEQDCIAVEIFTNALADAEMVQKLLEEQPRTLARAYEIAHRFETTKRAARAVTQLMQPGARVSAAQGARTAALRENVHMLSYEPPERAQRPYQRGRQSWSTFNKSSRKEAVCHNCSGIGHLQRNCPSPRSPAQKPVKAARGPAPDPGTVFHNGGQDVMCVQIVIQGREIRALLDSGARRNVLPLHHFNTIPAESRPQVQASIAQTLQGIGPEGLAILGEVILPVHVGSSVNSVDFLLADMAEGTEVILGHPFLQQSCACLDYGRQEITLLDEKIPFFGLCPQPQVLVVRVAPTMVLEPGCEYVVPRFSSFHCAAHRDMILSPTKGFVEKHQVLVAHAVVQPRTPSIPIRVFNPGAAAVTLKRGAVAGVLQPVQVLEGSGSHPPRVLAALELNGTAPASVPSHLQALYADSSPGLTHVARCELAGLLRSYGDVFSTGPNDLGRTSVVQHDILTTPGPPVKQPPRRMAGDKQIAADQQQMHDGPVGGHFGAERTLARLKNRYYWYNMKDDVTLWCRTCTSCAERARPLKTPQAAMGTVRVGAPMERIPVDLMGPLNETERHNQFILVVQDYFSKWVEAYPVPNEQAPTVAEKVVAEWVCRYGAPQSLHSDQGTNFESAVFQGMCELFGIKKTHTMPFHPQSDGQVERFNATLQKALASTAERCHWDIMIPYAVMAYRATKHSSTGLTPNMMLLGREITEPIDLVAGLPADETPGCTVLRLKPYHSRAPLDNNWVFQDSDQAAPIEVLPPALDESDSDIDFGPFDLWEAPSGADQPDTGASLRTGSPPPALGDGSRSPASPVQPYMDGAEGPGHHPSSSSTPCPRPQRVRRAPDMFGDWLHMSENRITNYQSLTPGGCVAEWGKTVRHMNRLVVYLGLQFKTMLLPHRHPAALFPQLLGVCRGTASGAYAIFGCTSYRGLASYGFLATGDSFRTIAFSFRVGVSTVCQITPQVATVMWDCLVDDFMAVPSPGDWRSIAEGFQERWNFPLCCGALDGKHVQTKAPHISHRRHTH